MMGNLLPLLIGLALPGLRPRDAPGPPPEPLQPRDYASASGEWVLHIDPSQIGRAHV